MKKSKGLMLGLISVMFIMGSCKDGAEENSLTEKPVIELNEENPSSVSEETINNEEKVVLEGDNEVLIEKVEEPFSVYDEITVETSQSYFLLNSTYSKHGHDFVVVDYVGDDGSNVNKKLRTFLIDDTFYTSTDYCGAFGKGYILTFEDVKNKLNGIMAYIEVEDGIVKCIDMNTAG